MDVETIQIRVDDSKAQATINKLEKQLNALKQGGSKQPTSNAANSLSKGFDSVTNSVGNASRAAAGFGSRVAGALGPVGAIAGGIATAFGLAYAQINRVTNKASDLVDLAGAINTTTESVQTFAYFAEKAGIAQEQAASMGVRFQEALADLRRGADGATDTFSKLGLKAQDFAGKDFGQSVELFAKRFDELKGSADANTAVLEVFGQKAGRMKGVLSDIAEKGFGATNEKLKAMGVITDDVTNNNLDQLGKKLDELVKNPLKEFDTGFSKTMANQSKAIEEIIGRAEKLGSVLAKILTIGQADNLGQVGSAVANLTTAAMDTASSPTAHGDPIATFAMNAALAVLRDAGALEDRRGIVKGSSGVEYRMNQDGTLGDTGIKFTGADGKVSNFAKALLEGTEEEKATAAAAAKVAEETQKAADAAKTRTEATAKTQAQLDKELEAARSRVQLASVQIALEDDLLQAAAKKAAIEQEVALIQERINGLDPAQKDKRTELEKQIMDLKKQEAQIDVEAELKNRELSKKREDTSRKILEIELETALVAQTSGNDFIDSTNTSLALKAQALRLEAELKSLSKTRSEDVLKAGEIEIQQAQIKKQIVEEEIRMRERARSFADSLPTVGAANKKYDDQVANIEDAAARGFINPEDKKAAIAQAAQQRTEDIRAAMNERIKAGDASMVESFKAGVDEMVASWGNAQQQMAAATQTVGNSIKDNLTGSIMDFMNGTKSGGEAFESFANSVVQDIIRIMVQQMIAIPVAQALMGAMGATGFAMGGAMGGGAAGTGHSGGLVGLMPGLRRFHSGGLVGDEVPVIAKAGERVMSVEEQRQDKSDAKAGAQILNVFDPDMIGSYVSSNPDIIVNVIGGNQKRIKAMLGLS